MESNSYINIYQVHKINYIDIGIIINGSDEEKNSSGGY